MKAIHKILAVAVAAAGAITIAGCARNSASPKTLTSANWNVRTSSSVEKSFSDLWLGKKEVAEYDISFTDGSNGTYSVKYNDGGVYKTEFGMKEFDWSAVEGLPEGYGPEESADNKEYVYFYTTQLNISGEYKINSGDGVKSFTDTMETTCYFRLAGDNLQPVYSHQKIHNTAPNTLNAPIIEAAYIELDGVYETFYNYNCTKATIKHTDNLKTEDNVAVTETGVSGDPDYSVFDNCQLRQAVRAMKLSSGSRYTFNVLTPQNGYMQTVYASCSAATELDAEDTAQKGIIDALDACAAENPDYIFFDKGEGESAKQYRYNAVSMGLATGSNMTGYNASLWYATVENSEINSTKGVLLRISTPLPFGLGTLDYNLKSLKLENNV